MRIGEIIMVMASVLQGDYIATVVFSGLTIVFSALLLLIACVYIIGNIFDIARAIKAKRAAKKTAATVQSEAAIETADAIPIAVSEGEDDDDVIAVIAAAIAAIGEAEGKTLAIKSVRQVGQKPSRNAWATAAARENMRGF